MPKLYVHVVCEKVILDQQQAGVASLIGLFGKLRVGLPPEAPQAPPDALAPKEWSIYSSWDAEPADDGKEYTLCTQVLYPDKKTFGEISRLSIQFLLNHKAQGIVRIPGFPFSQEGSYAVRTWLEDNGKVIAEANEIKVDLEIIRPDKTQ